MEKPNPICSSPKVGVLGFSSAGKARRLNRVFSPKTGRTLIVPIDDSLIFGPAAGLEQVESKLESILQDPPDAVLAFPGVFRNQSALLSHIGGIVNITASTVRSIHTRKVLVGSVHQSAQLGLDAVAIHVNISSKFESEMIQILGQVSRECESYGMPLLGIMYPRSEASEGDNNYDDLKKNNRIAYAELVAHSARVAVDLGVDFIKTKYTGDRESFRLVLDACQPVPIVVAGGPLLPVESALEMAYEVMQVGGAGVSFGRNVFSREFPRPFVSALKAIIHEGLTLQDAQNLFASRSADFALERGSN